MKLFMDNGCKMWLNGGRSLLLVALFFVFCGSLLAQSDATLFPPKPSPAVFVHDYSGWLSAQEKGALEHRLQRYFDSTSTQIVVMIRPDIGDYDKAGYAFELGKRWGIGSKSKNNGIVMLIKTEAPERGIFIATGYGAEGALPDITSAQIVRNVIAPYFRQNQYFAGISAGLDSIISALSGEFKADEQHAGDDFSALLFMLIFFLLLFFILYMSYKRRNAMEYTQSGPYRRRSVYRDHQGGGGGMWWGTGGWSSGGGGGWSSGDGGGWSGGDFGGGDFGGGGAGGDW